MPITITKFGIKKIRLGGGGDTRGDRFRFRVILNPTKQEQRGHSVGKVLFRVRPLWSLLTWKLHVFHLSSECATELRVEKEASVEAGFEISTRRMASIITEICEARLLILVFVTWNSKETTVQKITNGNWRKYDACQNRQRPEKYTPEWLSRNYKW